MSPGMRSFTFTARQRLQNQRGAVDLPSIMVGAIVLGLLTAAILATVFTVIPWAQDNAAKQKASQVVSAQSVYYAKSTDGSLGGTDPHYGSVHGLIDENLLTGVEKHSTDPTVDSLQKLKIGTANATAASGGNDLFTVWVRSDTGKVFKASENAPQPETGAWGVR